MLRAALMTQEGFDKKLCEKLGVEKPKGKTMLSGCVAFTVYSAGKKIVYYGIRLSDQNPVCHKSFNPELCLYNYQADSAEEEVWLTTDMLHCLK